MIELGIVAGHGYRSQTMGMFASRHQIFLEESSKRKGKRAPRGSFPTGPGAGFDAATSLWWSIPEIATLPEPDPARTSEDQSRIRAQHSRENFEWLNRRFPDSPPQANLFTPGTGTGETGFGPNV